MSKGDNLVGIPTTYKEIEMRSKLESKFAFFLDCLKVKWKYEPKTFNLSNGITYIPDFYLPELKTWVEIKGKIEEHNKKISRIFVEDNNTELLLVSNEKAFWVFKWSDEISTCEIDRDVLIGQCSSCNKFFFCGNLGSYHCRKCKTHEGDHDIIWSLQSEIYGGKSVDFYDLDSLKEELKRYGVSVPKI